MKGSKPRLLFVCGQNKRRSPTAEKLYAKDQRIEVRSAGLSEKSPRRLKESDLLWADAVLAMEEGYKARIKREFRGVELPPVICLEIPDDYEFMDAGLQELLLESVESVLRERFGL